MCLFRTGRALLALFAAVLQFALPALHVADAGAVPRVQAARPASGEIALGGVHDNHDAGTCPVCRTLRQSATALLVASAGRLFVAIAPADGTPPSLYVPGGPSLDCARPRAPPVLL